MVDVGTLAPPVSRRASAPDQRTIRRRRTLPGSRAVVGALLVTTAAVGLYSAYSSATAGSRQSFVVARRNVPLGIQLRPGDLGTARMELPSSVQRRAYDDPRVLVGAVTVAPVNAGDLVQASSVVRRRSAVTDQELTVPVERSRMIDGLERGERVDVLATYGSGGDAYTLAAVRRALVVAVHHGRGGLAEGTGSALTVAVTNPAESMALAHAARAGQVTVVRSTGTPPGNELGMYRPAPLPLP